jgi:hypothetical protein
MEAPALKPRLRDALQGLREAGVEPTDAEIVWLGSLAEKCAGQPAHGVEWVAGSPVVYAGLVFWPWHRLAEAWYRQWYPALRNDLLDEELLDLALYAYAHIKSKPGDRSLRMLSDYERVKAALRAWLKDIPLQMAQLVEVCGHLGALDRGDDGLIPNPEKLPKEDAPRPEPSPLREAAFLCKAFPGTTPSYWWAEISTAETEELCDELAAAAGTTPGEAPDPNSPRIRAIHNFRMAVKWILKRAAETGEAN